MKQLRRVIITWNNWQEDFKGNIEVFDYFKSLDHVSSFVIGFEIGEKGTKHIQAVIFFDIPKRFETLRKYFKNNHIEKVISTKGSIEYCMKEQNYITYGDLPLNQGKRTDIQEFKEAIEDGLTDLELLEQYTSQYFRYEKLIPKIRQLHIMEKYSKVNRNNLKVFYIYGKAGAGKTSLIYDMYGYEDVYRVNDYKNPFDQYTNQKVLVLDEFGDSDFFGDLKPQLKDTLLLNVLDIYPLRLPARYSDKWAVFNKVFIISNYNMKEVFGLYSHERFKAIDRRIIREYNLTKDNRDKIKQDIKELIEVGDLPF